MQSDFSRDLVDPDQPVKDAALDRPGQPIKVRIQPGLLRASGQYKSWKQVSWTLDCDNVDEALVVRDAMAVFFRALARVGPTGVCAVLQAAMKDAA